MHDLDVLQLPFRLPRERVHAEEPIRIERSGDHVAFAVDARRQVARRRFKVTRQRASARVTQGPGWLTGPRINRHEGARMGTIDDLPAGPCQQMMPMAWLLGVLLEFGTGRYLPHPVLPAPRSG